jgi:hypothetical protein
MESERGSSLSFWARIRATRWLENALALAYLARIPVFGRALSAIGSICLIHLAVSSSRRDT